jgi:hypothetical protein
MRAKLFKDRLTPTELAINQRTAKTLGIVFPQSILVAQPK